MRKSREEREKRKLETLQQKDFQRYGIKPGEVKYSKQKGGKSYKPLIRCLKYVKEYKWQALIVLIAALIMAVLSTAYPLLLQQIIDFLYAGEISIAFYCVLAYCGIWLINELLNFVWEWTATKIVVKTNEKLQLRLIQDIGRTQVKKFDQTNTGEIISRINEDADSIVSSLAQMLDYVFMLLRSVGYFAIFFVINVWVGLALVVSMIIYYIIDCFHQKYRYQYQKKIRYLRDKSYGITNEYVRGIRDAKLLNIADNVKAKQKGVIGNVVKARLHSSTNNMTIQTGKNIMFDFSKLACMSIAFLAFLAGGIEISGMVLIMMYSGSTLETMVYFSKIKQIAKTSLVSAERVCEIMDEDYPKETFGTQTLENVKGKIQFKNVKFAYKDDKPLFEDLNFTIKPKECVGFVGKSGQGKSTIVSLIAKLYDIQGGQILIDGVDIKDLTEDCLRENICVVSQSPYIFNMSIKENMLLAKSDATDEEIVDACQKAYLTEFIDELPDKYETQVGEGGVQLSGGQKQRLAIARALLSENKIILFDEATSALDNESQEYIKKAIKAMQKSKTIVMIAHRLTTVIDCDKIFVVARNKVVGEGTHKELLQTCDEYKNLYKNDEEM